LPVVLSQPRQEVAPPPEEEVLPPPEEEVAPKIYKVGLLGAVTGYMALWGLAEVRCIAEFGAEKVNEAGGIKVGDETYQLEFILGDTASDPVKAVDAAYKLVFEDKVGMVYSGGDPIFQPTQSLFEENNIISWLHTTAAFTSPEYPHTFHTGLPSCIEGGYGVYQYMLEQYPDVKTVFIVNQDDVNGRVNGVASEALAEYFGLKLVAPPEYFDMATIDFTPIATKIVSLQPDVLDISGTFDLWAGLILEAVHEMGTPPWKVIVSRYTGGQAIVWAGFDPELVEGIISWMHDYTSEYYPPYCQELAAEYIDRYGGMDVWGMTFTDIAFQMKSAIEQAGSIDKDEIYEFLSSPGAEIESMVYGKKLSFYGSEWWYYGNIDRQLKVPSPVAVSREGADVVVRMVPYEEYSKIFPYMTEERLPGII